MLLVSGPVLALLVSLQAFIPLWAQTNGNRPAEADKLHVVLLVAGHDKGIGNADLKDIAAMKKAINAAFAQDKTRVIFHDLTGINKKTGKVYSAAEILNHLRGMKIGKNDNVMVYHSGHGGITNMKRPEQTHTLVVDGGDLHRKDIKAILQAKSPRALMILTDCCSSLIKGEEAFGLTREAAPTVNVALVRNLLLKPIGIVNITAAQDGTEASAGYKGVNPGQAGSAFTVALMRLWYKQDANYGSWEQFFPALKNETYQASGGAHSARAFQISTRPLTTGAASKGMIE